MIKIFLSYRTRIIKIKISNNEASLNSHTELSIRNLDLKSLSKKKINDKKYLQVIWHKRSSDLIQCRFLNNHFFFLSEILK